MVSYLTRTATLERRTLQGWRKRWRHQLCFPKELRVERCSIPKVAQATLRGAKKALAFTKTARPRVVSTSFSLTLPLVAFMRSTLPSAASLPAGVHTQYMLRQAT